jgi:hypothetical protein
MKEITIDGKIYIPKDECQKAESLKGMEYVIVRTYSAGVFAGYLKSRNGKEGVLMESRRLWYWDGAASLSQLAIDGVSAPESCKFPTPIDNHIVTEIIEIIPTTEKSKNCIQGVEIWKA